MPLFTVPSAKPQAKPIRFRETRVHALVKGDGWVGTNHAVVRQSATDYVLSGASQHPNIGACVESFFEGAVAHRAKLIPGLGNLGYWTATGNPPEMQDVRLSLYGAKAGKSFALDREILIDGFPQELFVLVQPSGFLMFSDAKTAKDATFVAAGFDMGQDRLGAQVLRLAQTDQSGCQLLMAAKGVLGFLENYQEGTQAEDLGKAQARYRDCLAAVQKPAHVFLDPVFCADDYDRRGLGPPELAGHLTDRILALYGE
jgi:hypothetical protein